MRSISGGRAGAALPLALLTVIVLATLASAFLVAVTDEVRVARSRQARVEARFRAMDALAGALEGWTTHENALLRPGEERVLVGDTAPFPMAGETRVSVEATAPGLFIIRSSAALPAWGHLAARSRIALLVRGIQPAEIWAAFGAAATADSGAAVHVTQSADIAGDLGDACDSTPGDPFNGAARPGLAGPATAFVVDSGAAITGQPAFALDTTPGPPAAVALGPVDSAAVDAIADRKDAGSFALGGVEDGDGCALDAPGNWGDPADSTAACARYFPLVLGAGDIGVTGGSGQGVIVATHPLHLEAGSKFRGLILASAGLSLDQGATVEGAVRVARGAAVLAGTIRYSRCAIARALAGSGPLNRAFRPLSRSWVPSF
jgi:hypothetical protein